jgi:hypothetical protein
LFHSDRHSPPSKSSQSGKADEYSLFVFLF